jgi:hypothetical protein
MRLPRLTGFADAAVAFEGSRVGLTLVFIAGYAKASATVTLPTDLSGIVMLPFQRKSRAAS